MAETDPAQPAGGTGAFGFLNKDTLALLRRQDRFVILALGLIAATALAIALAIIRAGTEAATEVVVFAGLALAMIFLIVLFVLWRAGAVAPLEDSLREREEVARRVNGNWWQLVPAQHGEPPFLTYVSLGLSPIPGRHGLFGITFDLGGRPIARFSSSVVALRSAAPIEFYYVWRGAVLPTANDRMREGPLADGEEAAPRAGLLNGIGRMRFDCHAGIDLPLSAEGEYSRGGTREMAYNALRITDMRRFSADEEAALDGAGDRMLALGRLARAAAGRYRAALDPGAEPESWPEPPASPLRVTVIHNP